MARARRRKAHPDDKLRGRARHAAAAETFAEDAVRKARACDYDGLALSIQQAAWFVGAAGRLPRANAAWDNINKARTVIGRCKR